MAYAPEVLAQRRARYAATNDPAKQAAYRAANRERIRANQKRSREKTRDARRALERKRRGIVDAPSALPSGPCEICAAPTERLNCDHDHSTGAFRGWLCRRCNVGLGFLECQPGWLEKAQRYLATSHR